MVPFLFVSFCIYIYIYIYYLYYWLLESKIKTLTDSKTYYPIYWDFPALSTLRGSFKYVIT